MCLFKGIVLFIFIMMSAAMSFAADKEAIFDINMREFNFSTGELSSTLNVILPGNLMDQTSGEVNKDIYAIEKKDISNSILKIEKNTPFSGFNSQLPLLNQSDSAGDVSSYPFDKNYLHMLFSLSVMDDKSSVNYPFSIDCSKCAMPGSIVTVTNDTIGSDKSLSILIERTTETKVISITISILMLILSFALFIMTLRDARSKNPPNLSKLGFISGLLFALPVIRDMQPGVPPIGSNIDYFGFIEAEMVLILCLITTIFCWLARKGSDE